MKLRGTHTLNREQIDELITSGLNFVYFSEPVEKLYQQEYRRAAAREFRYRAPMVFFLYAFLTYGVYHNFTEPLLALQWFHAYKWVGFIILLAWIISFFRIFDRFFDLYTSFGSICSVGITFWLINASPQNIDTSLLHASMMYAVVIIYSFVGMRFYTALLSGWVGGVLGAAVSQYTQLNIDWTYLSHTYIFSSFLGMSLAYAIDRQHRENYLQNCIIEAKQFEIQLQSERLERLSEIDPLTSLANRRYLNEKLQTEWRKAQIDQTPLTIMMLDIDYFKNYNDALGHITGDHCLQAIANILKNQTQALHQFAARYGGEEFLLVYPNTDRPHALLLTQQILSQINHLKIKHPASPIHDQVTVSIGTLTAIPSENDSLAAFIETVDKALYEAKNKGRNRYQIGVFQQTVV